MRASCFRCWKMRKKDDEDLFNLEFSCFKVFYSRKFIELDQNSNGSFLFQTLHHLARAWIVRNPGEELKFICNRVPSGYQWVPVDTQCSGYQWVQVGTQWVPVGDSRYQWVPVGTQWVQVGTSEYHWVPSEYQGVPVGTSGYPVGTTHQHLHPHRHGHLSWMINIKIIIFITSTGFNFLHKSVCQLSDNCKYMKPGW